MSLFERCAGLFMVGFKPKTPAPENWRLLERGLFGAILFSRNVGTPQETAQLVRDIKTRVGKPFAMAVDQEGGRVARLRGAPFTHVPPMRHVGAHDATFAAKVGTLLAYEVRSIGFDWDFAPVLDVDTNPQNPVIGDRSFARDPQVVARLGVALGQAMEAAGVAACAKHFPGHGDTSQDSHLALPRLPHALDRLREIELAPFAAWAKAQLSSVMTAHVVFDALDPGVPATMSQKAMGLLRNELGFQGVLVSDDLEMKAIAQHFSVEDAVVKGVLAGVDLFLVCHDPDVQTRAIEALVKAVETGVVSEARVDESRARLASLARKFVKGPESLESRLGSPQHLAMQREVQSEGPAGIDPTER